MIPSSIRLLLETPLKPPALLGVSSFWLLVAIGCMRIGMTARSTVFLGSNCVRDSVLLIAYRAKKNVQHAVPLLNFAYDFIMKPMKNMAQISAVAYGYSVFLGFSYIIGFWIQFNFNILEYIEIMDLLRFSTMSLIPAVSSLLLGSLVGSYIANDAASGSDQNKKIVNETSISYSERAIKFISKSTAIAICIFSLPVLVNGANFEKTIGLYPLLSLLVFYFLTKKPEIISIDSIAGRAVFISVVTIAPSTALISGYIGGLTAMYDSKPGYIISNDAKCKSDNNEIYRYLSTVGGKVFSISLSEKSICISRPESLKLQLHTATGSEEEIIFIPWWHEKISRINRIIKFD